MWRDPAAPIYRQDGQNARSGSCASRMAMGQHQRMDGGQGDEVGWLAVGQSTMWDGHCGHAHNGAGLCMSRQCSTGPGWENGRKRQHYKAEWPRPRGLTACRWKAGSIAREVPAAPATISQALTAIQTAAWTATQTQTKANAQSGQIEQGSPTLIPESEGTHRPSPRSDHLIKHGRDTYNSSKRSECHSAQQVAPGNCVRDQQSALPSEDASQHWDIKCEKEHEGYNHGNCPLKRNVRNGTGKLWYYHQTSMYGGQWSYRRRKKQILAMAECACHTTCVVHGQQHRRSAIDERRNRWWERTSCDSHQSVMTGELALYHRTETTGGDLRVVSSMCSGGEQAVMETA